MYKAHIFLVIHIFLKVDIVPFHIFHVLKSFTLKTGKTVRMKLKNLFCAVFLFLLLCIRCHFGFGPFLREEVEMMRQEITINWFVTIYKENRTEKETQK